MSYLVSIGSKLTLLGTKRQNSRAFCNSIEKEKSRFVMTR